MTDRSNIKATSALASEYSGVGGKVLADVGVVGMGVMGRNLARNFASRGFTVALFNRSSGRTEEVMAAYGDEGSFLPSFNVEDFVASLERPRKIVLMVVAGNGTDAAIDSLVPYLEPGDIVIDGGNAHFPDTRRREAALREQSLHFVGAGISGGEEGALLGPAIMPGGPAESYDAVGPLFEAIAAKVDGEPCCTHVGPDGAGHFVKMVHNGIEYSDMQLIAEAYDLLRQGLGATPGEIAEIFANWNEGDLESFLIEITAEVLGHVDAETGRPFIDIVVDDPVATSIATADTGIVEISQGYDDGSAVFNPGARALAAGTATITITLPDGSSYDLVVTVSE